MLSSTNLLYNNSNFINESSTINLKFDQSESDLFYIRSEFPSYSGLIFDSDPLDSNYGA